MASDKSLFYGFRGLRWLGKPYCSEDKLPWWKALTDILIITVITALSILVVFEDGAKHERISTFVSIVSIVGNNFLASNLILLNLRRNHPLVPVVKSIYSLPSPQPASNHIAWLLFGFSFVLANLLTDLCALPMFKIMKLFPVFYLSDTLVYLFLAQFIIPLLMIGDRLSNILQSLRGLGMGEPSDVTPQFDELLRVHSQLINLCIRLKQIYSWPLLVIVASKLFGATASMYHSACVFFDLIKGINSVLESYSALIGAVNEIYMVWCVIHTAWIITEKVKRINGEFYTLCINDDSYSFIQNDVVTSFLEQRISLSFSAHGFFGLDHSLLRSILATIASYLFIIIQFQIRSNLEEKRALRFQNRSISRKL
ncbi:Gustatory receptor 191 [Halyomorpha halys]|nr:Gustatory receptor 191 [Halyomorpha halys]